MALGSRHATLPVVPAGSWPTSAACAFVASVPSSRNIHRACWFASSVHDLTATQTNLGDGRKRGLMSMRHTRRHRSNERGQATVEYVGLAVAVAVLLVSVGSGLGDQGGKLGSAVAKRLVEAVRAGS